MFYPNEVFFSTFYVFGSAYKEVERFWRFDVNKTWTHGNAWRQWFHNNPPPPPPPHTQWGIMLGARVGNKPFWQQTWQDTSAAGPKMLALRLPHPLTLYPTLGSVRVLHIHWHQDHTHIRMITHIHADTHSGDCSSVDCSQCYWCSTPIPKGFPNIAFETVLMFIWLTICCFSSSRKIVEHFLFIELSPPGDVLAFCSSR